MTFGFVDRDKVLPYNEHRAKFEKKGNGISLKTAVQRMDEFMSDPKKFRTNVSVSPNNNKN